MIRSFAKTVSFGLLYGQTASAISRQLAVPEPSVVDRLAAIADPDGPAADRVLWFDDPDAWTARVVERWRPLTDGIDHRRRDAVSLLLEAEAEQIAIVRPVEARGGTIDSGRGS